MAGNPLAILLCVVAYMALGMVWYGMLFMKPWAAMTGMDKQDPVAMKKAMAPTMLVSVATGFVLAVVLGRGLQLVAVTSWLDPLLIATVLWFPFTCMTMAQTYAYTFKPFKLLAIDAGYLLVSMWVMALILYGMAA